MKKLLLFLLIFVGINSYGQTGPHIPWEYQYNAIKPIEIEGDNFIYDTLKVEFLISDTSHWFDTKHTFISHKEARCKDSSNLYHDLIGHIKSDTLDGGRKSSLVHSIPGYLLIGRFYRKKDSWEMVRPKPIYLDHNKKPFKKDIVVHSYVIVK